MHLLCLSLPPRAAATPVALHEGALDPTSEGWELAIAGDSGASGGTEMTASGAHSFWEVRDSATDGGIAYGLGLTLDDLSADWRLEVILRVVEAPTCPGCVDFGDVGVIIRDGPGAGDDTADFLVDGLLVFDDVGRSGLWTASDVLLGFGAVSTAGVGTARWERVLFDDGRVPEPNAVLLLGAAAAAFLARRRARR
jgi:hypothetical protein